MLIIYHTFILLYYMMFQRCVWIATLAPVMIYDWAQSNKVGMSSCVYKLFDGKYVYISTWTSHNASMQSLSFGNSSDFSDYSTFCLPEGRTVTLFSFLSVTSPLIIVAGIQLACSCCHMPPLALIITHPRTMQYSFPLLPPGTSTLQCSHWQFPSFPVRWARHRKCE